MNSPIDGGGNPQMDMLRQAVIAAQMRMQNRPASANSYMTGTQHENAYAQQLGRRGISPDQSQDLIKSRANQYAETRLGQFSKIADLLGGGFADAFHSQDMSDPAAAYRTLSGVFSQQSKDEGVADPRALLTQLLMQAGGGHGAPMSQAPRGPMQNAYLTNPNKRG